MDMLFRCDASDCNWELSELSVKAEFNTIGVWFVSHNELSLISLFNFICRFIALFESLSRICWSICLSYIIFACAHDSGGPVNRFLSLPIWQPLAKLSYAVYLDHYLVIAITTATLKTPPSFSALTAFQSGISIYALSTILAIPLVLGFELPIDAIYKLLMDSKSEKPPSVTTQSKPIDQCVEKYDGVKIEKFDGNVIERV